MNNNTKYDHIRPIAIALRMRYPEWTSRRIVDELVAMGHDPFPTPNTVSTWCRNAGLPYPYSGMKRRVPIEIERRVLKMKIAGMITPRVIDALRAEGIKPPSTFFINRVYRDWRRENGEAPSNEKPEDTVKRMLRAGIIELGEAWDELVRLGMDDDQALSWVMDKFYGGPGYIFDSDTGSSRRRGSTGGTARVYSIREGRRVAA